HRHRAPLVGNGRPDRGRTPPTPAPTHNEPQARQQPATGQQRAAAGIQGARGTARATTTHAHTNDDLTPPKPPPGTRPTAKQPDARPAPSRIAGLLAPGGAAALVSGGWLPGALVEQVSRTAVRLLNLETEAGEGSGVPDGASAGGSVPIAEGAMPANSGPVSFSSPAVVGRFGPPPVMPAPGVEETPPERRADAIPSPTPAVDAVRPTGEQPERGEAARSALAPETGTGTGTAAPSPAGKLSLTVAAVAVPGEGGRGRRLSCSVALALAGALAVVTVGSAFLFDLVPDSGGGGAGSAPSGRAQFRPGRHRPRRRRGRCRCAMSAPGKGRPPRSTARCRSARSG
ncbi:hypothetical protein AB0J12_31830, partial [Streptomyces sp. NPDC049915]